MYWIVMQKFSYYASGNNNSSRSLELVYEHGFDGLNGEYPKDPVVVADENSMNSDPDSKLKKGIRQTI